MAPVQNTAGFQANVPSRPKLLPRRGGTQTSKSFLTTHLQAMIVNFESLQKQKVLALKNKIKELQDVAAALKDENKSLRQTQKQNDREMTEITAMIVYHEKNVKDLRSKVRESELNVTFADSKARKQNSVMVKLNDKCKEYQELLNDENLEDKEILAEKLETMEEDIVEKDKRIMDKEQTLLTLKKKIKSETKKEQSRYQDIQKNINLKKEECQSVKAQILNKSKEIHRKNIYSRCSRKAATFPAIGWYPDNDDEQPSNEKVQNWLKAIQNTEHTQSEKTSNPH